MITKDMMVCDILDMNPEYEKIFEKYLLLCTGCPGASSETLEQAAEGHGVDLEKLLDDLNRI